jgi:SAM-dependent methyltransferase
MKRALLLSWSSSTSSVWTPDNPARGQCSVTALVVRNIMGGEILKTSINGLWHFYNRIEGRVLDFTAEQFTVLPEYLDLPATVEEAFADTNPQQYETLLRSVLMADRSLAESGRAAQPAVAERVQSDFDRIAAFDDGRWDHNRHYHGFLLRFLPAKRGMVLEIGCGTGAFARCLAQHFERVLAIDLSPEMIRRARESSQAAMNVEFRQADFRTYDPPAATFDCIAAISTLHHLPLEESLRKLIAALRPGGVLLVLDLYEPRTLVDWIWSTWAFPFSLLLRVWKLRQLREDPQVRRAWSDHARHDVYPSLPELRSLAERLLPGARVRRHLLWRYSLVWCKTTVPA